ncbi:prephenate dehydratase [Ruminococcus gauvreauii]|uniref:prephenate dehydratase n=1 Tax=Ruminococcus gauvreauii TaxID=438033 RepID=UPI0039842392
MIDLQEIRNQIDEIDDEILKLFEKRMHLTGEVAQFKIKTGKQVFDKERELQKLKVLKDKASGDFNAKGVQELFQQIMSISRKRQYQLLTENGVAVKSDFCEVKKLPTDQARVVFQGVEGAYSFAATHTYFGESVDSFHVETWRDAMDAIADGRADYAVLPIENSTAGIVADIYDLLVEYQHNIVAQQIIRAEHVLMGVPGSSTADIRTVYSHPQALRQCRKYLDEHPGWKEVELLNTAVAAKKVKEDADISQAAIASRQAAEHFGLAVLNDRVFYSETNSTRFIIVSGKKIYTSDADKISICFELPHESGTLYNILAHFIYNDLNMTKIESRPLPEKNWEYRFFVDFEGNLNDSAVKNALRGIEQEASALRVFGNYR